MARHRTVIRHLASRLGAIPALAPVLRRDPARGFEVRHFAGPDAFLHQLSRPLRVVHLTDLHVGRVTPMPVQHAAVDLVNAAQPDLVVVTGDFVCHGLGYLDALAEVLGRVQAPVFGVMGNHDYWAGAAEVRRVLRLADVEVLDNAHTTVTVGGQRVQVVGLDDAYTGHADRERAVKGLRADLPTLGLSHIAEEADGLWAAHVPLVFSGHTHAGQITLARINEIALGKVVGHRYVHGLYGRRRGPGPVGAVYVGAGVGAAVMPLRLGERARREVAVFELGVRPGVLDEHHDEQPAHPGRAPSARTRARRQAQVLKKAVRREKRASRRSGKG